VLELAIAHVKQEIGKALKAMAEIRQIAFVRLRRALNIPAMISQLKLSER